MKTKHARVAVTNTVHASLAFVNIGLQNTAVTHAELTTALCRITGLGNAAVKYVVHATAAITYAHTLNSQTVPFGTLQSPQMASR